MSLLEPLQDTQRKSRRLIWVALLGAVAVAILLWFTLRYYPEKRAAEHFFDAVVAEDMSRAYQLWKPLPSYTMQDFLADWGPDGYYGPVKSYRIMRENAPRGANGVVISVQISPFAPFPSASDIEKSRRTKTIGVWVLSKDKSFSFPP